MQVSAQVSRVCNEDQRVWRWITALALNCLDRNALISRAGLKAVNAGQVDQVHEVLESLVIEQRSSHDAGESRVVLFVRLRPGAVLTDEIRDLIRRRIREHASPHHVPKVIVAVADIPRTISGKITELAVRDVVHGRTVRNADALANPEALALFREHPSLLGY